MSCSRTIRVWTVLAGVAVAAACGGGDSGGPTAPPTVDPPRATTVMVSPATAELDVGEIVQLTAVVRDQNSNVMAGASVTWMSGAGTVATVNASGLVTGVAGGTATITARSGSAQGTAQITVVSVTAPVVSVEVSSPAEPIALGEALQLSAEALDENGRPIPGVEFSWESSNTSVATVDATGLVTAVAAGTATITASAGDVQATVDITVVSAMQPVVSVEVSPSAETIAIGTTRQLSAEAFDENGQAVAGVEFSWESNNTPVATVDASGLVTGVAEGSATIFASAGSVQGRAHIAVVNPVASPDREILVALYNATDGPNWGYAFNWLTDAPLGDWSGVETNALGRVTELNLPFNDLSGSLPVELGNLASLTTLRLEFNDLSGPIPAEFGNLSSLENVDLSFNELSGPIPPELGKLTNLTDLDLSSNQLSGPIPTELAGLTSLTNAESQRQRTFRPNPAWSHQSH